MSFGLYAIGFAILIGGLIYGAHLVHVPTHWTSWDRALMRWRKGQRGAAPWPTNQEARASSTP